MIERCLLFVILTDPETFATDVTRRRTSLILRAPSDTVRLDDVGTRRTCYELRMTRGCLSGDHADSYRWRAYHIVVDRLAGSNDHSS